MSFCPFILVQIDVLFQTIQRNASGCTDDMANAEFLWI